MKWCAFLNAFSEGISGGDACFLNVAKHLSKTAELTIITSKMGRSLCLKEGIKAKYLITTKENHFKNIYPTYLKRIFIALGDLKEVNTGIIYSSSDSPPDVFPSFFLKLINRKIFWVQKVFHIVESSQSVRKLVQRISFALIKWQSNVVIVDSESLKAELVAKYGFLNRNIEVVRPGIDIKYIKYVPPWPIKFEGLFVGQLRKSKGIFDLIPIWKKVVEQLPSARLFIVGQDVQNNLEKLKRNAKFFGIAGNVNFLGFVPKGVPFALMKAARVLLLPSYEEGFGLVLAESITAGLRPVAYDLPVFKEYFDQNMSVVPKGDKGRLASEVIRQLSLAERERNMKNKGFTEKFDINESVEKEVGLIKDAFKKSIS